MEYEYDEIQNAPDAIALVSHDHNALQNRAVRGKAFAPARE